MTCLIMMKNMMSRPLFNDTNSIGRDYDDGDGDYDDPPVW